MSRWPLVRLGEHVHVKHGFAFRGENFSDHGDYIVLTPGNFMDTGGFKEKSGVEKYYTAPPSAEFVLRRGDLVIAMTEQKEGLLGSSALIPTNDLYLHNQRIGLVQQCSADTDRLYLYYLFNTRTVRDQIQATATGSKVRHTAPMRIENILVPFPPLVVQQKIGSILSAYDDLIENSNRRIKILEEMTQRIYREWMIDFRYPRYGDVPMEDSELGEIPLGWRVCPLSDVAVVNRGLSWDRAQEVESGGCPIITIPNVQSRLMLEGMTQLAGVDPGKVAKYTLLPGDTVLVGSNGNPERVGQAVWIPRDVDVLFASFLMCVRSFPEQIGPALLHMQMKDPRLTGMWRSSAIGSTGLRNIRLSTLKESLVLLPDEMVRTHIERELRDLLVLQDTLDRVIATAKSSRDLLLHSVFSGGVDLTNLDISMPEIAA